MRSLNDVICEEVARMPKEVQAVLENYAIVFQPVHPSGRGRIHGLCNSYVGGVKPTGTIFLYLKSIKEHCEKHHKDFEKYVLHVFGHEVGHAIGMSHERLKLNGKY